MGELKTVTMYTDGACSGNPGPGGYGVLLQYRDPKGELHERSYSEGFADTTNNRMEVTAAIIGFEKLKEPCHVILKSDSKYLLEPFLKGWMEGWVKNDFRRGKRDEVKNIDLWERLLNAMKSHEIEFVFVKGHAGDPGNERCDRMAVQAYQNLTEGIQCD